MRRVRLVGIDELIDFSVDGSGALTVTLPERLPVSAVTALDLGSEVRARGDGELGGHLACSGRENELGLDDPGDESVLRVAHVGLHSPTLGPSTRDLGP